MTEPSYRRFCGIAWRRAKTRAKADAATLVGTTIEVEIALLGRSDAKAIPRRDSLRGGHVHLHTDLRLEIAFRTPGLLRNCSSTVLSGPYFRKWNAGVCPGESSNVHPLKLRDHLRGDMVMRTKAE